VAVAVAVSAGVRAPSTACTQRSGCCVVGAEASRVSSRSCAANCCSAMSVQCTPPSSTPDASQCEGTGLPVEQLQLGA
jgi:hypothetical protein